MVNVMKELLSFQGVGGCLLELLLDQLCCAEIALVGLNENLSLLNNFERKKTYTTRENIASVIIQHITLLLVSQATSKVIIRKCLIKVSSTFKHAPCVDRRQRFCFYTDGVADCFSTPGLSFEFVHGVHIEQHALASIQVLPQRQQRNKFLICSRLAWHNANIYNLFPGCKFDKRLQDESYNQQPSLRAIARQ